MEMQAILEVVGTVGLLGLIPLVKQIVKEISVIPYVNKVPTLTSLVVSAGFYAIYLALPDAWEPFMGFAAMVSGLSSVYNDLQTKQKADVIATQVESAVAAKEAGMTVESAVSKSDEV